MVDDNSAQKGKICFIRTVTVKRDLFPNYGLVPCTIVEFKFVSLGIEEKPIGDNQLTSQLIEPISIWMYSQTYADVTSCRFILLIKDQLSESWKRTMLCLKDADHLAIW